MKKLTKKEKRILLKEFDVAHAEYSTNRGGHWKSSWKQELEFADLKDGYWYWKGHRVIDLFT